MLMFPTMTGGVGGVSLTFAQALFANGEAGVYLDLYADDVLWQDAAKTIPATADGHPVRVVVPVAGTGTDLTAPSDAARATLRIVGNVRWLELNGVDQRMISLFTVSQPWTRVTSVRVLTRTSGRRLYSGGTAQAGEFTLNGATSGAFQAYDGSNRNFTGQLADNTDGVITEEHNSPSGTRMATDDGAFTAGGNSGTNVPGGWNIGSLWNGSVAANFGHFRFYGGFMIDRLLTAEERGTAIEVL